MDNLNIEKSLENSFEVLFNINLNEKTEQKEGLTYLSWAWAWAEFKKIYPAATYNIKKNEQGLPFFYDTATGYICFTEVTGGGLTYEMWLPVMDNKNKAMKSEPYTYKAGTYEKTVQSATMFDINKTIMRCLAKNLAMFGLGLYIYAGEDLPEAECVGEEVAQKAEDHIIDIESPKSNKKLNLSPAIPNKSKEERTKDIKPTAEQLAELKSLGSKIEVVADFLKVKPEELTSSQVDWAIRQKQQKINKQKSDLELCEELLDIIG